MNKQLADAISLVEEAGGIIMMPDTDDLAPESYELVKKEMQEQDELKRWQEERKENLENLAEDFSNALKSENFSIGSVADICYQNGCDLDDLEEMIHQGKF